jgi:hypothetical protein
MRMPRPSQTAREDVAVFVRAILLRNITDLKELAAHEVRSGQLRVRRSRGLTMQSRFVPAQIASADEVARADDDGCSCAELLLRSEPYNLRQSAQHST